MDRYLRIGVLAIGAIAMVAGIGCTGQAVTPACSASSGGSAGAEAQLRFVEFGEHQVTFTFGASSASDTFGVPPFSIDRKVAADGRSELSVRFTGSASKNPDGSTSYNGPLSFSADTGMVRGTALALEEGRTMSWRIALANDGCPIVASKTYVYGKSPRAQVAITFGTATSVTFEHSPVSPIGSPAGSPVQLSGFGFAPSAPVYVRIGSELLWDSHSDAAGLLDTGFVPLRPPDAMTSRWPTIAAIPRRSGC